ncbi:unnamed protein product [Effrenium voratum]|nr:unnamed protein product [Effrenium voratum]
MGHAACALGCAERGCSGCSTRTHVVEVEVPTETLSSRPRRREEASCLESWHGAAACATSTTAPLDVKPAAKKPPEPAKASHLAPLPTLQLDMPAAVAAAFLESARAEADAKYRRKLACRAAREEAAGHTGFNTPEAPEAATTAQVVDSPSRMQEILGLDGKFVSSGAIRQRLQEMEDGSVRHVAMNRMIKRTDCH